MDYLLIQMPLLNFRLKRHSCQGWAAENPFINSWVKAGKVDLI
jgi:hypothetical protein